MTEPESQVDASFIASDGDIDASLRPKSLDDFIGQPRVREQLQLVLRGAKTVSYTHLTLPTICSV